MVAAFVAWLEHNGRTQSGGRLADVYAERGAGRLWAEARGQTAAVGLDVDPGVWNPARSGGTYCRSNCGAADTRAVRQWLASMSSRWTTKITCMRA